MTLISDNDVKLLQSLSSIKALVLDCDGVLTSGDILYDAQGRRLLSFFARDGLGLALLCRAGIEVGVLSGRPTDIAQQRHEELGVRHFIGRCHHKGEGLVEMSKTMGVSPEQCAFLGDDLADLSAFARCGVAIAVQDAAPEVLSAADWVTQAPGGRGAVREVCEAILKAQGHWEQLLSQLGLRAQ